MAAVCEAPPLDLGMVKGLLFSVDCNVQSMTEASYGALARPASPMALALTTMLTLYIAFIGFRLMLGRAPLRVGELTVSALKIGAVLALATSWPTYQHVVFDVLFNGPEQLAAGLLREVPSPSLTASDDVFASLQAVYDRLQAGANQMSQAGLGSISPLQGGTGFAALGLNAASQLLLLSTLGVVLASKIVLGLLLGLGPVFIALLLFQSTQGLFEGWLRASIAFALAPLAATVGLALQLLLIVPELDRLAEAGRQTAAGLAAANAVFLLSLIGAGVSAALMIAMGVIAVGLRLRGGPHSVSIREAGQGGVREAGADQVAWRSVGASADMPLPSRAVAIASAALAMERREAAAAGGHPSASPTRTYSETRGAPAAAQAISPIGQGSRRRVRSDRRTSNLRRDA